MEVLVLGGTQHVGRAIVEEALARWHTVTTLNRGLRGPTASGVRALHADRLDADSVRTALRTFRGDVAIDTWSGSPRAVSDATSLLVDRVDHYTYVSSRSVYRWPIPVDADECSPVVEGDPFSDDDSDYAAAKRGGEFATTLTFAERALIARAGLILGPYEIMGRLPWWLRRLERGGRVLCPGPSDRKLQYIDGRDLASFILTASEQRLGGTFNTVSHPGHTTMGELLEIARVETGSGAELFWVSPSTIEAAGFAPWTELPIWVPPTGELSGLHCGNVSMAQAAGLRCRPIAETIADTWKWLIAEGDPATLTDGSVGLSQEREAQFFASQQRIY